MRLSMAGYGSWSEGISSGSVPGLHARTQRALARTPVGLIRTHFELWALTHEYSRGVLVHFRGHVVHGSYESHHPAATAVVVRSAPARVLVLSGVAVISSRSPLPPGQSPTAGPPVFVWYTFVCAPSAGPALPCPPDSRVEKRRAGKGRALEKNAPRQGVARIEGPGEVLRRERMRFRGASRRGFAA